MRKGGCLMETVLFCGPVLQVPDPASARDWLCRALRFAPAPCGAVQNGSCVLFLRQGPGGTLPAPAPGHYYTGLAHVALHARDIAAALAACRQAGLTLTLQNGGWLYNPKVFGAGEYYFNAAAPFGLTVEFSQPVAQPGGVPGAPFAGLDHLGVPCADFSAECAFLEVLGFSPVFSPVENYNEAEGRIRCVMLRRDALVLEVYQFLDQTPLPMPTGAVLQGIAAGMDAVSPSGLRFFKNEV